VPGGRGEAALGGFAVRSAEGKRFYGTALCPMVGALDGREPPYEAQGHGCARVVAGGQFRCVGPGWGSSP